MFEAHITPDELFVLLVIREHATAYGRAGELHTHALIDATGLPAGRFTKDASYLEEHGLIGAEWSDLSTRGGPDHQLSSVWLTGLGEDYMRSIEAEPSGASTLTSATVRGAWTFIRDVAVKTLSEIAVRSMRG